LPPLDGFDTFATKSIPEKVSEEKKIVASVKSTEVIESEKKVSEEKSMEVTTSPFSYIKLLEEVKKIKSTLVLDLKTARFELAGTLLTLIFSKEWHYNRTNTPSMKNIISESLTSLYTGNWIIECRLDGMSGANIADDVF
jgi:hypothetical protein